MTFGFTAPRIKRLDLPQEIQMAKQKTVEPDNEFSETFVQESIDKGCQTIIELVEFNLMSVSPIMRSDEIIETSKAFASLKHIFNNRQQYMSKKVVKVWQDNIARCAIKNKISPEMATIMTPSPIIQLWEVVSPAIKGEELRKTVHLFMSAIFLWMASAYTKGKRNNKNSRKAAKQIVNTLKEMETLLGQISENVILQMSLQYNTIVNSSIKQ